MQTVEAMPSGKNSTMDQNTMKEKYLNLFDTISKQMVKLETKKIKVEEAKAFASLAKQANNILGIQLSTAKFIVDNTEKSEKALKDVGLES